MELCENLLFLSLYYAEIDRKIFSTPSTKVSSILYNFDFCIRKGLKEPYVFNKQLTKFIVGGFLRANKNTVVNLKYADHITTATNKKQRHKEQVIII